VSTTLPLSPSTAATPARNIGLDGIRGLACLLVLIWHYSSFPYSGTWPVWFEVFHRAVGLTWAGVDLFFVLSGYLLGTICLKHRDDPHFFGSFYLRRAWRILPLYYVLLGLGLVLPALVNAPTAAGLFQAGESVWPYLTLLQDGYFTAANGYGSMWLAVTWSLSVEMQFYLVLPLVLRRLPARWLPYAVLVTVVGALALRTLIVLAFPGHVMAAYWLLPCRWDALFLGVLAAYLSQQPAWRARLTAHLARVRWALAATAALLLVFLIAAPGKQAPLMASVGYSVIDFACFCLVLLVANDARFARCFGVAPLRHLGTVSYGVYLFHVGVAGLLHGLLRQAAPELSGAAGLLVTLLAAGVSVLVAWLAYRVVEKPLLRVGHGWHYGVARQDRETPADAGSDGSFAYPGAEAVRPTRRKGRTRRREVCPAESGTGVGAVCSAY
jgi:peptidoglycan/LPS O-acetylase OafA/YrhL